MSLVNFSSAPYSDTPGSNGNANPFYKLSFVGNLPLNDVLGIAVLFLAGFLNLVDVQVDKDSVELDKQVLAKLLVLAGCGLYGALGFVTDIRVRKTLFSFPMIWIVMIVGCYFVAASGSITQTESLASAIAMLCITLMTVTAIIQLGSMTVLATLFYSLSLFIVLSWIAFLFVPAIGVFEEPIAGGQFTTRMSGLAHPNTLGQFSGLTIVLGFLLCWKLGKYSMLKMGIIILAGMSLIGSLSRTSILATVIALFVANRTELLRKQYLLPYVLVALIGAVTLLALSTQSNISDKIEEKLSFLSKSGDTSELTSATGRADIWAFAIRKVAERPLTGYGAATSKYYMQDYSSYTHNLIINVLFSTGVFGGILALVMCAGRVVALFTKHHIVADAIVAFILVNGLFENVIFSFLAGLPTIIWITGLCLPQWMPEGDELIEDKLADPIQPQLHGIATANRTGDPTESAMPSDESTNGNDEDSGFGGLVEPTQ